MPAPTDQPDQALREAWQIINVLHMEIMDRTGQSWPRALDWLHRWEQYKPSSPPIPTS